MTDVTKHTNLYYLVIFRLLFQVLRPVRLKYKLSIHAILILNSCYLYSKLVKDQFYYTDIYKFTTYFDMNRIKKYIMGLTQGGFINAINPGNHRVLYQITAKGIEVIESIEQYYNKELYQFYNKYNIQ